MKLLLVQPVDLAGAAKGNPLVAVDAVGAGEGELVLLVQGSSARQTARTDKQPGGRHDLRDRRHRGAGRQAGLQ